MSTSYGEYRYVDRAPTQAHAYLLPHVLGLVGKNPGRVLDFGCGNGSLTSKLPGEAVVAVDLSESGIEEAKRLGNGIHFQLADVTAMETPALLGPESFDAVVSCEVVEHLYEPRAWARNCYALLKPGGLLVVSTPYHGYLKNFVLAASGKMDAHFTALWDSGHIKFWSYRTLRALLAEAGFDEFGFRGAGRWPYLWKSMVVRCRKPQSSSSANQQARLAVP